MKKKLLTTVLTVGVVLSLVGCGAKETTSSESVAETTVTESTTEYVEETIVVEETEVAEESVKEKIPVDLTDGAAFHDQLVDNYITQGYFVISKDEVIYDTQNLGTSTKTHTEYLYSAWDDSRIGCIIENDKTMYVDGVNGFSYVPNDDMTGFDKVQDTVVEDTIFKALTKVAEYGQTSADFVITELTEGEYAGYYVATNQLTFEDIPNVTLLANIYVDPYTLLPISLTETWSRNDIETTLEDGTTIASEDFIFIEYIYHYQYPKEGTEDFATFQSAIQLPADDECTLVEE